MGSNSKILSNPRLLPPISVIEFADAIVSTWGTAGSNYKHVPTIGLAVSGGVDSMALAVLCSQVQKIQYPNLRTLLQSDHNQNPTHSPLSRNIRFQAFMVDHGVRDGSDLEAQAVSKVLAERNIPAKLLKIHWTGHEKPGCLPNFESLARKYRFQALGKACRDLGINSLLLAHHEDDLVETVLTRLVTGHRASGLVGMQPSAEIAECYGLHGVHESGGFDSPELDRNQNPPSTPEIPKAAHIPSSMPLETETGGVRIYRPLLGFSKERLISTCIEERMEWFEDHTNNDPTVTIRNAIRYMYKSHTLPAALSKPSILALSKKCRDMKLAKRNVANSWLEHCSVKFGTRTGTLRVRFANLLDPKVPQSELDSKYIAALLLRRLLMLVTPREHVTLSSLINTVERVFPERFWLQESSPPTTFTVAGLLFRRHTPATMPKGSEPARKCEWLISRQPYKASDPQPRIVFPVDSGPVKVAWSPWTLYDGRFWIRVQNFSAASMVIRPVSRADIEIYRQSLSKQDSYMLRNLLKGLSKYGIISTLPVIACKDEDGEERFLALPTLGVSMPNVQMLVKWEARYKKVDRDHISTPT